MLRRPSDYYPTPRGDGCSSTAVESVDNSGTAVGNNPAGRGSAVPELSTDSAVPRAVRAPGPEVDALNPEPRGGGRGVRAFVIVIRSTWNIGGG